MPPRSSKSSDADAPDVYVGLLFVSLAAIISGIVFLCLELNKYNWQVSP